MPDRGERQQGRAGGAEAQADEQRDQDDRGDLDQRQCPVDQVALVQLRRVDAGHADQVVAVAGDVGAIALDARGPLGGVDPARDSR